jgi:hypothetical protein
MNKIIISGLEPGFGGVPRFLEYLDSSIEIICPRTTENKKNLLDKIKKYFIFLLQVIKNNRNHAIIMHHNSIPTLFLILIYIIYKKVEYFAIDNSYFCNKSYNVLNDKACFSCLGNSGVSAIRNNCKNFPANKNAFSAFIERYIIRRFCINSTIYSLSDASSSLINQVFPKSDPVSIGFSTIELRKELSLYNKKNFPNRKYFVFHGSNNEAKGFLYSLALANEMKEYEFIFPMPKPAQTITSSNCRFIDMRWESGLREYLSNALFILCPSTWTYTPEAAMLKSFILNDNVGYFDIKNSFSEDIPNDLGVKLSGDTFIDARKIEKKIRSSNNNNKGKEFVRKFLDKSENLINIHILN